jgi:hypothetical protein
VSLAVDGERGGLDLLFMVAGTASFEREDGERFAMSAGDCLIASAGVTGPLTFSPDLSLVRFFISPRAESLRERTPAEIARLVALGPRIVTGREVRKVGDKRAVNFLHEGG